jgi:hypothetical protein
MDDGKNMERLSRRCCGSAGKQIAESYLRQSRMASRWSVLDKLILVALGDRSGL